MTAIADCPVPSAGLGKIAGHQSMTWEAKGSKTMNA